MRLLIWIFGIARVCRALMSLGIPFLKTLLLVPLIFAKGSSVPLRIRNNLLHFYFRAKSTDLYVLAQTWPTYFPKTHLEVLDEIYNEILSLGRTPLVLDGGAYTGITALKFLQQFPQCKVIAIEAARVNYKYLTSNMKGLDQVECVLGAIGDPEAFYTIEESASGEWAFRTSTLQSSPTIGLIPGISLARLLETFEKYTPFICKLDIEGAEASIPDPDWDAISQFPVIVVEPHDWMMPGSNCIQGLYRSMSASGQRRDSVLVGENIWFIMKNQ
jgi:FkbM family methyltransferase